MLGSGTLGRAAPADRARGAPALPAADRRADRRTRVTALALTTGSASLERVAAGTAIDAGGLVPDLRRRSTAGPSGSSEVDPLELLEVQLCNSTAPFILVSRLRPAMAASPARRTYVVNVSAMEGQFSRGYKGPGHPHTNMAKAALNMLTRTSAAGDARDRRHPDDRASTPAGSPTSGRTRPRCGCADEGFHAPLDLVDGAARVYDPIVRGEAGEDLYGCFLKDYAPSRLVTARRADAGQRRRRDRRATRRSPISPSAMPYRHMPNHQADTRAPASAATSRPTRPSSHSAVPAATTRRSSSSRGAGSGCCGPFPRSNDMPRRLSGTPPVRSGTLSA